MSIRRLIGFGLQRRYLLTITSLVVGGLLSLSTVLIAQFQHSVDSITESSAEASGDSLLERLVERGVIMSATLADYLVNPLYNYDMEQMSKLLETVIAGDDVLQVLIVDEAGKVVHDGSDLILRFGQHLELERVAKAIQTGLPTQFIDTGHVGLTHPIVIGEEIIGAVDLTLSRESTEHLIKENSARLENLAEAGLRRNMYTALVTGVLFCLVGTVISFRFSRSLTRPIINLSDYAHAIGQGDYKHRLQVTGDDELGWLTASFNTMCDSLEESNLSLHRLAYRDPLTGLPNRAQFAMQLERAVRSSVETASTGALMFIDLDDFKRINDTLGHDAGDELLQEVSLRFVQVIRGDDSYLDGSLDAHDDDGNQLARQGGDEFTVVLAAGTDSAEAERLATRLIEELQRPVLLNGNPYFVGASIGISFFPQDSDEPQTLMKNADLALYQAKDAGKNAYRLFESDMDVQVARSTDIERELRLALCNEELELYYQPQVRSSDGEIVGCEALLRWNHPQRGIVPPLDFIPVAEQSGLIVPIGEWVLAQACRDAFLWQSQGHYDVCVAVNVSAVQLDDLDFLKKVRELEGLEKLAPQSLHIEITESSLMQDEERVERLIGELRQNGIEVWMDDFGTGYSSLSYLRRYPFSGVKIDRGFTDGIPDEEEDCSIVLAVLGMAKGLGLRVVAEGVETVAQRRMLSKHAGVVQQGYLHGKPMPLEALLTRLATDRPLLKRSA